VVTSRHYKPLSPTTPTMTVMSTLISLFLTQKGNVPSFFPPTKSIPSSIARSIKGLTAPVCSLICLAFAHRASETACGSNLGRLPEEEGDDEGGEGGEKVSRTSRISSSYLSHQLTLKGEMDSLRGYRLIRLNLGLLYLPFLRVYGLTLRLSLVHPLNVFRPAH
jgi:hypothetical protein